MCLESQEGEACVDLWKARRRGGLMGSRRQLGLITERHCFGGGPLLGRGLQCRSSVVGEWFSVPREVFQCYPWLSEDNECEGHIIK